jgi:hypothetical protein
MKRECMNAEEGKTRASGDALTDTFPHELLATERG